MKQERENIRVLYKKMAGMLIILVCVLCGVVVGLHRPVRADVCARVKIEILQELTFERVAFDAMMKINNESDIPLTNIHVEVSLANPAGANVADLFFVRLTSMDNIGAVDGTGTVAPFSTAEIHWLIIPSAGAGGEVPQGQVYYAGATLGYNMGGVQEATQVVPDSIVVKPQPLLVLDYFEPRFVWGDDPFTPETESPIPYNLGVRVRNIGFGYAKSLVIDSGQPKIVENEQGLLIDFRILGSEINGNPAPNNLLVNFGDIAPQHCGTARWEMVSTLSGEFIEFAVSFTHSDELGGELTSLIEDTYAHLLVHEVMMDSADRDRIKDFLAYEDDDLVVFESDNLDTEVTDVSLSASLGGAPSSFNPDVTLDFTPEAGAIYARLPDPAGGNIQIESVTRSDGKNLLADNYWISLAREEHQWHAYVNVFDVHTTGSYTISYLTGGLDDSVPPVSHIEIEEPQFSQDPTFVNSSTEFLFLATDELSGVNQIFFRIDEGTFGPAVNPFMFSQRPAYTDGTHTLSFYSRDNEGNEELAKSVAIYLDTQSPVIEALTALPFRILPDAPSGITWAERTVTIDYSASDDTGQVVAAVEIYAGGEASSLKVWEYQETISSSASSQVIWEGIDDSGAILPPGSYTLRMRVTDPLGQSAVSEAIALEVGAYFSEQELSPCDGCAQMYPAISQDVVVWQDNRNGDFDIYLYNVAEQSEVNLSPLPGDQTRPATDGLRVVWQDNRNGNEDIYLYDLTTEQEVCIVCDNNSQIKPAISGEWIVWQDNRYGNWDIFGYNMTTEEVRHITEDIADQVNPSLSGQVVVWEDYRNGLGEIYSLDLSTGDDTPLTDDEVNQTNPVISEGKVVWIDQSIGTRRIYLYDCAEGAGSFITDTHSDTAQAALAGGYVIYTDYEHGVDDPNPYFHILTTDLYLPLTLNTALQEEPDIFGNRAVWQDDRSGKWRIYMVDVSDYFSDEDDDDVADEVDICPDTPMGEEADSQGCSASQRDSDGDGIYDNLDNCPYTPNEGQEDRDGDGIGDACEEPDTEPPVLTCPDNITEPATSLTTSVYYEATAIDNEDPEPLITYDPPSGYEFPLGTTTVTVTATDFSENSDVCTFTVTVEDMTGPEVICPDNITVSAESDPMVVEYLPATVTDNCDAAPIITYSHPSGSEFPLGVTTVTVTATDASNNESTCTFTVTVEDNEAPVVTCPDDIVITATSDPMEVTYPDASVTDNFDASPVVTYSHPSGSLFPVGVTIVTVTATDAADNSSTCTFTVTLKENHPPSVPRINSPQDHAEVISVQPDLIVNNSTDPDEDSLLYTFELYSDDSMEAVYFIAEALVEETESMTAWAVQMILNDNTWYYWRVRASDGMSLSNWVSGSFFVNTANDPPGNFTIANPLNATEVDNLTPTLQVNNSNDVDEDTIDYTFEVYGDDTMTVPITTGSNIQQGDGGSTSWTVDKTLNDNTWYYWRVTARDEHGATTSTTLASFFVNTFNDAPVISLIVAPPDESEVDEQAVDLVVHNATDLDEDQLIYFFEIDTVNTFDSENKQSSGEVSEGITTTRWHISGLSDNTFYFWRAKASDGYAESSWIQASFFVNTANDPPSKPVLKNPGNYATVETLTPTVEIYHSEDPDRDALHYLFEVYSDTFLVDLISQGTSTTPEWTLSTELNDNNWYYWVAQAEDEHGAQSERMDTATFFVNNNGFNDPPELRIVEPSEDIETSAASILIWWDDDDPDSNATIALYYDSDNTGNDGTLIVAGLNEDPDDTGDSYQWDISDMPNGTYYIYATIADGSSSSTVYSQGTITIHHCPLLPAVNLHAPSDKAIDISLTPTLTWNAVAGALSYHVNLVDDNDVVLIDKTNITATYFNILAGVLSENTTYTWKVFAGNACGENEDTIPFSFSTVSSTSPSVTVTSPNGGEVLDGGSSYEITWNYTGAPGTHVDIRYNTGGRVWITITATADYTEGSYLWIVPDVASTRCRIRVTSVDDSGITDMSDANFEIQ